MLLWGGGCWWVRRRMRACNKGGFWSGCSHVVVLSRAAKQEIQCSWDTHEDLRANVTPVLVKMKVIVAQSCLTLCNPVDCSLPGSSVRGLLQARILERVPISFSRRSFWPRAQPRSPALQADSLPSEPPGQPQVLGGSRQGRGLQPEGIQMWAPSH